MRTCVIYIMIALLAVAVLMDETRIQKLERQIIYQQKMINHYIKKVDDLSVAYIMRFGAYPRRINP